MPTDAGHGLMRGGNEDLVARVRRHAAKQPDKPFARIVSGDAATITYGELWDRAGRYAAGLAASGVSQGDIVPVILPYGGDLFSVFLGCMIRGARPCIMPPHTPKQDEASYYQSHDILFSRVGPRLIVMPPALQALYNANLPRLRDQLTSPARVLGAATMEPEIAPDGIAFLQFSSGTTALKKGVMISHAAVRAQCARYAAEMRVSGDDVFVSWLPLYHDMGLITSFILPMWAGATVVGMDNYEWLARPRRILDLVAEHRGTLMWQPNFAFNYLAQRVRGAPADLSSLRAVVNCSEPCRPDSHWAFETRFADWGVRPGVAQTCYAMAEATFAVTQSSLGKAPTECEVDPVGLDNGKVLPAGEGRALRLISCGAPLRDFELRVIDGDGADVAEGLVGEIAVRGPSMAAGYFGDPELTAQRFLPDGFYLTRDLGFIRDGELYVLGRVDDIIVVFGRKLRAPEIEAALGTVPGVKPGRAIVLAQRSAVLGTNEVYFLYEADVDAPPEATVAAEARQVMLADTGLSFRQVIRVEAGSLLKTTSGKLSRPANTRLLEKLLEASESHD